MKPSMRNAFAFLLLVLLLCNLPLEIRGGSEPDCSAQVVQLSPCLSFASNQVPTPPPTCCDALGSVVMNSPICLCEIIARGKNGSADTGLPTLNLTLVRQLPADCGILAEVRSDESRCSVEVHGTPSPSPYSPSGSTGSPGLVPSALVLLLWGFMSSAPVLTFTMQGSFFQTLF